MHTTADVGHHLTKKFFFRFFRVDRQMLKNATTADVGQTHLTKNSFLDFFQGGQTDEQKCIYNYSKENKENLNKTTIIKKKSKNLYSKLIVTF